ncbi:MAG TPA: hypothetical protein VGL34_02430 [Steroidobacteraceae bacterium]|jgi:hypothetical protein
MDTNFLELKVYNGFGEFHLNRFRIAFERPKNFTKEALAREFVANFPRYLRSDVARVEINRDRTFNRDPTLKFWGSMTVVGGLIEMNRGVHHDWVAPVWVDDRRGFTVQTLKRMFWEPWDDVAAAVGGAAFGAIVAGTQGGVFGGTAGVDVNRFHFLAGRRSWCLDTAKTFGQYTGDFAARSNEDILILETGAVERFSHPAFLTGDYVAQFEQRIPPVWMANLENFVRMNGLKTRRITTPRPVDRDWRLGGVGAVTTLKNRFKTLAALQASPQLRDMIGLYPKILPEA